MTNGSTRIQELRGRSAFDNPVTQRGDFQVPYIVQNVFGLTPFLYQVISTVRIVPLIIVLGVHDFPADNGRN
jgi:hypothetical protein